jgi:hypothetical protein
MDGMAAEENKRRKRNDPGRLVYYNFTVGLQKAGRPHTRSNIVESPALHRPRQLHAAVTSGKVMPAANCSTIRTCHASCTLQYHPDKSCQLHTAVPSGQVMPAARCSTSRTGHASCTLQYQPDRSCQLHTAVPSGQCIPAVRCSTSRTGHASCTPQYQPDRSCQPHTAVPSGQGMPTNIQSEIQTISKETLTEILNSSVLRLLSSETDPYHMNSLHRNADRRPISYICKNNPYPATR